MTYLEIIFLVLTYLVSSIPFGLLVAKFFAKTDIRQHGSKNIGATNVSRTVGKKLGLLTLILDGLKGAVMIIIARYVFFDNYNLNLLLVLVAAVAVLGHVYSIYLNFNGGKGVATTIATLIALDPMIGIAISMVWIVTFIMFRISAIASLVSISSAFLLSLYYHSSKAQIIFCLLIFFVILHRHKENIIRLIDGKENKL